MATQLATPAPPVFTQPNYHRMPFNTGVAYDPYPRTQTYSAVRGPQMQQHGRPERQAPGMPPNTVQPSQAPPSQAPQVTAASSSSTPQDLSPTSPNDLKTVHQKVHIRPPKMALYVPAVLRPTEKPQRQSPPKHVGEPVYNIEASIDDLRSHSRRTTEEDMEAVIGRIRTQEWSEEGQGSVTGPPSRNHWKPDKSTRVCEDFKCQKPFTFFNRRHHCRRCGAIFCGQHSAHVARLNQFALFHTEASRYRVCDGCFKSFGEWLISLTRRSNAARDHGPATPGATNPRGIPDSPNKAQKGPDKQSAHSLAAGQGNPLENWSTF